MASLTLRLKRNGIVILTWMPPISGATGAVYTAADSAIRQWLDTPGGPAVYSLEASGSVGLAVIHRSLMVQGVKR